MKLSVLYLESDASVARAMAIALTQEGFQITLATTFKEAMEKLHANQWDAFLVDIHLPDATGFVACEQIKKTHLARPVLLLTSKPDEELALKGLQCGASDYLRKPIGPKEIAMRIHRALGREGSLSIGSVGINKSSRRVEVNGKPLSLRRREFDILAALAQKPGSVLRRDELLEIVRAGEDCSDRAIDCHLSRLRKKLHNAGVTDIVINSIYGVGYSVTEAA